MCKSLFEHLVLEGIEFDDMSKEHGIRSLSMANSEDIVNAIFEVLDSNDLWNSGAEFKSSKFCIANMPQIIQDGLLRYVYIDLNAIPNWQQLDIDEMIKYIEFNR